MQIVMDTMDTTYSLMVDQDNSSLSLNHSESRSSSSPVHFIKLGKLKELQNLIKFPVIDQKSWREAVTNRTLIHHAAMSNQIEVLKYLVSDMKIDINAVDSEGNTALHLAVVHGHVEALSILLGQGTCIDAILNANKDPALHLAIRQCPEGIGLVSEFVKHQNSALLLKGRHNRTTFHVTAESDEYFNALELIYGELLKRMHEHDSIIRMMDNTDSNGLTPIHFSARIGSHQFLEFSLGKCTEEGMSLKELISNDERYPLHYAVEHGHTECVRVLLKHGAGPVMVMDSISTQPLHLACSQGKLDIVRVMVKHCGKSVLQFCDMEGGTPLHSSTSSLYSGELISYLVENGVSIDGKDANGFTPLCNAILLGNANAVERLLKEGADPLIKDKHGRNSLHVAVLGKRMELFKQIFHCITAGVMAASPDDKGTYPIHSALTLGTNDMVSSLLLLTMESFKDREGNNYLHLSSMSGNDKSLTQLLSKPICNHMVNEANHSGFTPLHYAAMGSNLIMVRKLLDSGAVIHKNNTGHTPFMCACSRGNLEAAELVYNRNMFQRDWLDQCRNTALHLAVDGRNPKVITFCLDEGMAITLNDDRLSFFDKILKHANRKLAEAVLKHKRWEECISMYSPDKPHPIMRIIDYIPDAYGIILDQCFTKCSLDPQHPDYWEEFNFRCLICKPISTSSQEEGNVGSIEMADGREEYSNIRFQLHTGSSLALNYIDGDVRTIERARVGGKATAHATQWKNKLMQEEKGSLAVVRKLIDNRLESHLLHPVVVAFIRKKWQSYGQQFHFTLLCIHFLLALFSSLFLSSVPLPQQNTTVFSSNSSGFDDESNSTGMELSTTSISVGSLVLLYITLAVAGLNLVVFILEIYIYGLDLIKNFTSKFQTWINFVAATCTIIFHVSILVKGLEMASWNSAAVGVFMSWISFGFNMQLFNIFNIGIYITIFISITRLILKVMAILFVFILAFTFPFYILVGTVRELQYTSIELSLFSNLHALISATDFLGFLNLEQSGQIRFSNVVFLLLVVLIIMLPIVMTNLLIGLAVGDIALIQKEAIISRQSVEVKALASLDKKLLPRYWTNQLSKTSHKHYPNSNKKWSWITSFFHQNFGKKYNSNNNDTTTIWKEELHQDRELQGKQMERLEERMEQIAEDLEGIKRLEGMVAKMVARECIASI